MANQAQQQPNHYAVIDLGSNSFHMLISEYDGSSFQQIGKHKEKIQLASGLDKDDQLSKAAIERGLACIRMFAERIKYIPKTNIKVVGTYTLRTANNNHQFIKPAQEILQLPINILPGTEEARIIYTGVSHNHPDVEKALVIDIGGGSTEIILGNKFTPLHLDSLPIGCVTYQRFFVDGIISHFNFSQAILQASVEISPFQSRYHSNNWKHCLGSSGSIEAVYSVLQSLGYQQNYISYSSLQELKSKLIAIGNIEHINFKGLSESRKNTFTIGVAILMALFQELTIERIYISNASLREGVLLELVEQLKGVDIRQQTIVSLNNRFNIDQVYAQQVQRTANSIFSQVAKAWQINDNLYKNLLDWSCYLHEIGLTISYSKMRFHSAHIIKYADMPGFSQQTKDSLSAIIGGQKKRIYLESFDNKYESATSLQALTQILRLAILFNLKRDNLSVDKVTFIPQQDNGLTIQISQQWANEHQLIITELEREKAYLNYHNIQLDWLFV